MYLQVIGSTGKGTDIKMNDVVTLVQALLQLTNNLSRLVEKHEVQVNLARHRYFEAYQPVAGRRVWIKVADPADELRKLIVDPINHLAAAYAKGCI